MKKIVKNPIKPLFTQILNIWVTIMYQGESLKGGNKERASWSS